MLKKHILYIEDQFANIQLMRKMLRQTHYVLRIAEDGNSGLATAVQHPPDLVIVDLHLPDMDGNEVIAALRQQAGTTHIPIIALTADTSRDGYDACQLAGCNLYLNKPVSRGTLLNCIRLLLDTYQDTHRITAPNRAEATG